MYDALSREVSTSRDYYFVKAWTVDAARPFRRDLAGEEESGSESGSKGRYATNIVDVDVDTDIDTDIDAHVFS